MGAVDSEEQAEEAEEGPAWPQVSMPRGSRRAARAPCHTPVRLAPCRSLADAADCRSLAMTNGADWLQCDVRSTCYAQGGRFRPGPAPILLCFCRFFTITQTHIHTSIIASLLMRSARRSSLDPQPGFLGSCISLPKLPLFSACNESARVRRVHDSGQERSQGPSRADSG